MTTRFPLLAASLLTAGLLVSTAHAQSFTFTTDAGGTLGALDGTGTGAQFYNPTGVTIDSAGNLYVADQKNNAIRLVTPSGTSWIVTTIAGGTRGSHDGDNLAAEFYSPTGITIDSSGTLYVADSFNSTIRQIVHSGTNWVVTTIAGSAGNAGHVDGAGAAARFTGPTGLTVDTAGNVYVADQGNNCIRKLAHSGAGWTVSTIAGGTQGSADGTGTAAQFFSPSGIAADTAGRLFVADLLNNTIRLITPSGGNWVVTTIAGNQVAGLQDGVGNGAEFNTPTDVAVDLNDNVYVADLFNNAIREITFSSGNWTVTTIAGGTLGFANGTGSSAEFDEPFGVAADAYGDVFAADSQNNAIRQGVLAGSAAPTGSVLVNITPAGAVNAGAQWQLDGGAAQGSGTVLTGLTPGVHSLTFSSVAGLTTPATQEIPVTAHQTNIVTSHYGTSAANEGALQVLITPAGVVAAGAKWQVDGGALQTNGAAVENLTAGSHTVSFNTVAGWNTPANQSVTITAGQTALAEAAYVLQTGSLQVTILPATVVTDGAEWQVDGGLLQHSGNTLTGITPGTHTLSFNTVLGWTTPLSQQVTITNAETTAATVVYVQNIAGTGALQVTLGPAGAVSAGAQWQVDSGISMTSGTAAQNLAPGLHSLTFTSIPGWIAPPAQQVSTANGQTTQATGTYTQSANPGDAITVTILPAGAIAAGAEWQVDGGAFQTSGSTVTSLSTGVHTVAFNNIVGWTAPAPEQVAVSAIQPTSITAIYQSGSDRTKPVVTITTPAVNARLTNGQVVVQGKASEKTGISQVLYQLNGGGFQPATGTTNWSANLTLVPGQNIFQVQAIANSGTESAIYSRTVFYIVTSPLTVLVSGSGKVTPSDNGKSLVVGTTYVLTAIPNSGNLFSNWSGSLSSNTAVLKFVMQSNMVLQANFVANPFIPQAGTFSGLFYDTNNGVAQPSSGLVNLTLRQPNGIFSLSMQFAGGRFSTSGQFDLTGHAVKTVGPLTADLQLDFSNHLSGTISTTAWSAALTAERNVFNNANKAVNFSGDYTMVIPPAGDGSVSPGGYGYATISVNTIGGLSMSGSLADGTAFSQNSIFVNEDGQWPLFATLTGGGSLFGWITFTNQPASSLGGAITWIRPAGRTPKVYTGGFTNQTDATGSRYVYTKGVPVITLNVGQAGLSGPPLQTNIVDSASINNNNAITVDAGSEHLTLTLTPGTGAISGTFRFPGTQAATTVRGVILQGQNEALGYFLGTSESGTFQLQ